MLGKLFSNWRKRRLSDEIDGAVRTNGWYAIYVGDYVTAPTWAYSIGFLETLGCPEIVLFDIPMETANQVFWQAFYQIRAGDLTLVDGAVWDGTEKPVVWRQVHDSSLDAPEGWFTLAQMRWVARTASGASLPPFAAFQLVLCDDDGRLPWDPGYDERLRHLQPALWEPRPKDAPDEADQGAFS